MKSHWPKTIRPAAMYRQSQMFVGKTQPDPTYLAGQEKRRSPSSTRSRIGGMDPRFMAAIQETQNRLRSFVDGKLRLNPDGTLARRQARDRGDRVPSELVGGTDHSAHAVRPEHNAICDRLKMAYPQWDDNRLFNVARLINAAVMAKIHTVEWTPAILPNPASTPR